MLNFAAFYGVHGQAQKGIDLYARQLDRSYLVIQCKRSSDGFTPGEVTEAVDTFLAGDWAPTATVFVLAVTANLEGTNAADRIEEDA
jgi:predicted helicase